MELFEQEEKRAAPEFRFATVAGVYPGEGLTLVFDGETEAGTKRYRCNTSVTFHPGDRVKVCRDSGTYVVEYVVGVPTAE